MLGRCWRCNRSLTWPDIDDTPQTVKVLGVTIDNPYTGVCLKCQRDDRRSV